MCKSLKQSLEYSQCSVMFAIVIKLGSQYIVDLLLERLAVLAEAKVDIPNKG